MTAEKGNNFRKFTVVSNDEDHLAQEALHPGEMLHCSPWKANPIDVQVVQDQLDGCENLLIHLFGLEHGTAKSSVETAELKKWAAQRPVLDDQGTSLNESIILLKPFGLVARFLLDNAI